MYLILKKEKSKLVGPPNTANTGHAKYGTFPSRNQVRNEEAQIYCEPKSEAEKITINPE